MVNHTVEAVVDGEDVAVVNTIHMAAEEVTNLVENRTRDACLDEVMVEAADLHSNRITQTTRPHLYAIGVE